MWFYGGLSNYENVISIVLWRNAVYLEVIVVVTVFLCGQLKLCFEVILRFKRLRSKTLIEDNGYSGE